MSNTTGNNTPLSSKISNFSTRPLNRVILESKRWRNAENVNAANVASPVQERLYPMQKLFPSHLGRTQTSTPLRPKASQDDPHYGDGHLGGSSPAMTHSASPEGAYMRQNRSIQLTPSLKHTQEDSISHFKHKGDVQDLGYATSNAFYDFQSATLRVQNILAEKEQLDHVYVQKSQELVLLSQKYEIISEELKSKATEVNETRREMSMVRDELKERELEKTSLHNLNAELKEQLAVLKLNDSRLKEELERSKSGLETSRTRLAQLSELYAALGVTFEELRKAHDSSNGQLRAMSNELESVQKHAKNGLDALQPMLDNETTLTRAAETKDLFRELKDELTKSHQVTDILRDRLLYNVSQLADAQGRIRELEEERRGSLNDLLLSCEDNKTQRFNMLTDVERKVIELTEKLIARELADTDMAAELASLETSLKTALTEVEDQKAACVVHKAEREENVSKLLALQDIINNRDKECSNLKTELRALKESKEELRVLLAEAKRNLGEKEVEIRSNVESQLRIKQMTEEVALLKSQLKESEEKQTTFRKTWLTQENIIQKKLYESEALNSELRSSNERFQAELREATSKVFALDVELRMAKGEIANMKEVESELSRSRQEIGKLENGLYKLKVCMEEKVTQLEIEGKRASFAETSASSAATQLNIANQRIEELKIEIKNLNHGIISSRTAAERAMASDKEGLRSQIASLKKEISQLEVQNTDIASRPGRLVELYKEGKLTDSEKLFVSRIIKETQALQEEAIVKKDNELKRRERLIETLNEKISKAEKTIGRLLEEKMALTSGTINPMIDLHLLASDSNDVIGQVSGFATNTIGDEDETPSELSCLPDDHDDDNDKSGTKRSRSASRPEEEMKRSRRGPKMSNAPANKGLPLSSDSPSEPIQKKTRPESNTKTKSRKKRN